MRVTVIAVVLFGASVAAAGGGPPPPPPLPFHPNNGRPSPHHHHPHNHNHHPHHHRHNHGYVGSSSSPHPRHHHHHHSSSDHPHQHHHHHHQANQPHHSHVKSPRYYDNPYIIASPKPRSLLHAQYKSLTTGKSSQLTPGSNFKPSAPAQFLPSGPPRQGRSESLLASQSKNTPVLVLKKEVARPVLSSAVVAAALAAKQQRELAEARQIQQQQQQQQKQQKPQPPPQLKVKKLKLIDSLPTVLMPSPLSVKSPDPLVQAQSQKHEQITPKPSNKPIDHDHEHEDDHHHDDIESHESDHSSMMHGPEQPQPHRHSDQVAPPHSLETKFIGSNEDDPRIPPSASAERRLFFESVAENSGFAEQVSGPQGPSTPPQHKPQKQIAKQQQQHGIDHESLSSQHPRILHDNDPVNARVDEDEDTTVERIARSNSNNNPYGGLPFEYPPPQSNYIVQGPTRVPVKYQQGVVGIKPAPQQHRPGVGHPGIHHLGDGKPGIRPYKQRIQQAQQHHHRHPHQQGSEEPLTSEELAEEEEEAAQPDRLQELLANSKFACGGKKDGYYADDTLNCEVFHYCQDGGKHSWLCPNGFAFHQIHLICVPPSSDNICKQSSNFHFVNEYLYRPINEKEAEVHNTSLKYADRYFPDGYNHGAGDVLLPYHDDSGQSLEDDGDSDGGRPRHQHAQHHQQPHHLQHHQRPQPHYQSHNPRPSHSPPPYVSQPHGPVAHRHAPQQAVPFNPYSNVPSGPPVHHRPSGPPPTSSGGFIPSPQISRIPVISSGTPPRVHTGGGSSPHHSLQQAYAAASQHRASSSLHPQSTKPSMSNKSSHGASKSLGNSNVFFSPESINIPLNQRRPIPNPHPSHHPQIFRPSSGPASGKAAKMSAIDHSSKRKDDHHHHHDDHDYEY